MARAFWNRSASRLSLREYEVDPNDLSAITVAKKIGMPPNRFSRPCWTTGAGDYVFAVIPGDAELDFKKLARAAGWRKAEMAPLKDVQPLTGYIRGGVTVLAQKNLIRFSSMRRQSSSTPSAFPREHAARS